MTTYWHIAHPSYTGGDLLCRDRLAEDGAAPQWQWTDADEGFDSHVVCLFPDTPRGRTEAAWLWDERPDHHLLRIDLPDDHPTVKVEEGYPAVTSQIPAEHITLIRTGYADGIVTREGDTY